MKHEIQILYDQLKAGLRDVGASREIAVALTNLETSELWAEKAYEVKKLEQAKGI